MKRPNKTAVKDFYPQAQVVEITPGEFYVLSHPSDGHRLSRYRDTAKAAWQDAREQLGV